MTSDLITDSCVQLWLVDWPFGRGLGTVTSLWLCHTTDVLSAFLKTTCRDLLLYLDPVVQLKQQKFRGCNSWSWTEYLPVDIYREYGGKGQEKMMKKPKKKLFYVLI